ncbi:MAG: phosphatidylglycerophosphatase A [Rhodospirillaceae bacterium]
MITTWGGSGLSPKAPGTAGSLAALPFAWAIAWAFGPLGLAVAALAAFLIGWWASYRHVTVSGEKDPGKIVIDEVAGQWMTLIPLAPDLLGYALGFIAFRAADILKPWPASWADRSIGGGLGIMVDDIFAAIWSLAAMIVLCQIGVIPAAPLLAF